MNKYLNKGLLYAWFNSAKAPIMIGLVIWGFLANGLIESKLSEVRSNLADSFMNSIETTGVPSYFMLGFIFIAIYFIAGGINKRNLTMFYSSGPYTKKQIKYNEITSLLITLGLFIIAYIYIAIMAYIRNRELIDAIVDGYSSVILIEILKLIIFGIIGILFMLIVDMLFSNLAVEFIGMIFVIPISIVLIFSKISMVLDYISVNNGQSIGVKIDNFLRYCCQTNSYLSYILLDDIRYGNIRIRQLSIEVLIAIIIIFVVLFMFHICEKKYSLMKGNKIFSSKANENIVVVLTSIGIGTFVNIVFLNKFINMLRMRSLALYGMDLIKALSMDVLSIGIIGFIAYKIMKKILKNVV